MKKKKNPVEEDPWHAQTQSQSSISRSLIYDIVHNLRHRTQSKPNTHTHTHKDVNDLKEKAKEER